MTPSDADIRWPAGRIVYEGRPDPQGQLIHSPAGAGLIAWSGSSPDAVPLGRFTAGSGIAEVRLGVGAIRVTMDAPPSSADSKVVCIGAMSHWVVYGESSGSYITFRQLPAGRYNVGPLDLLNTTGYSRRPVASHHVTVLPGEVAELRLPADCLARRRVAGEVSTDGILLSDLWAIPRVQGKLLQAGAVPIGDHGEFEVSVPSQPDSDIAIASATPGGLVVCQVLAPNSPKGRVEGRYVDLAFEGKSQRVAVLFWDSNRPILLGGLTDAAGILHLGALPDSVKLLHVTGADGVQHKYEVDGGSMVSGTRRATATAWTSR